MDFIQASDRSQLRMTCLEQMIETDNPVRFVDAFVDKLDLEQLGYQIRPLKKEGRPPFAPQVFLKLYLYGYLNGLRSSRRLERECKRNIELQWLLGEQVPNYHSIADFRKDNPQALRNTFKLFVSFLKDTGLVGGRTVAIDGSKVRANNSKKNNYNAKKIKRHLSYIEEKTNEYLDQLEANDQEKDPPRVKQIKEKIARLERNKIKYELLQDQLEDSDQKQISTTDKDARALLVQGAVVEVSYNMQAAVDEDHKLIVATHTINTNDRNAMSAIALETKENLQAKSLTALLDKGYHNAREIQTCKDNDIMTICPQQERVNLNGKGTTPDYMVSNFIYNKEDDSYTCPQGNTLRTTGTWHKKTQKDHTIHFKKYRSPDCVTCPVQHLCTARKDGRREIERTEYAEAVEENNERHRNNKDLYRKRQEWNEHIFGTIKRKWGYSYTDLRGLKKVNGELSLIALVYNIQRSFTISGVGTLLEKIENWVPDYPRILHFFENDLRIRPFRSFRCPDLEMSV